MPHLDELLGVATFATAGLLAAIVLPPGTNATADGNTNVRVDNGAIRPHADEIVRVPSIQVVARRSAEGSPAREAEVARHRPTNDSARPDA